MSILSSFKNLIFAPKVGKFAAAANDLKSGFFLSLSRDQFSTKIDQEEKKQIKDASLERPSASHPRL